MKPRPHAASRLTRWVCLLAACDLTATPPLRAEPSKPTQITPGVLFHTESRTNPPNRLFVAHINLQHPNLRLHVAAGGPDPDGPGPWETSLLQPTQIAAREGFDLVVNGDFFLTPELKQGTAPRYTAGVWSAAVGPAVSHGTIWSSSTKKLPCLVVRNDDSVQIEPLAQPDPRVKEAIAGNTILVKNGKAVTHSDSVRHPRTVVGLDQTPARKLVILIVDGRKPGVATGMNYDELATEMLRLGCSEALNLDGGGSSLIAARDPASGAFRILNAPTDGKERPVANVLGITVK